MERAYDLVIRGGMLADGSGRPVFAADVAVKDGLIAAVGQVAGAGAEEIDARGADAGVEARLRLLAGQIARQASAMTLDAIRRGGAAYDTVRG